MSPVIFSALVALTFGVKAGAAVLVEDSDQCAAGGPCAHADVVTRGASLLQSPSSRQVAKVNLSDAALCESLRDVTIGSHSVGHILSPLCTMWPFGDFPVKSLSQARKILDPIFEENGVWSMIQSLSSNRTNGRNPKFCWRHEQMRQTMMPGSTQVCPASISKEDHHLLDEKDKDKLKQGMWRCKHSQEPGTCSCEKQACATTDRDPCVFPFVYKGEEHTSCITKDHHQPWCATETDSSGNFVSWKWGNCGPACDEVTYEHHAGECRNATGGVGRHESLNLAEDACREACSEDTSCVAYEFGTPDKCAIMSDVVTHGSGGSGYVCNVKEETGHQNAGAQEEISDVPSGCDMISWGACYDTCPHGYEPVPVVGGFHPVCQTKCSESKHHMDCGFGCASGVSSCAGAVVEQIGSVVRLVSKAVSIVASRPDVHVVFDSIVSLAEFFVTVLPKLIEFFKKAWDKLSSKLQAGEQQLGVILTIMELAQTFSRSFMDKFTSMHESFKQILRMFTELLDAEWSWGLDLDKISSILGQFGASEITLGFKLVEAFKRPKCEVADTTSVFTIADIGDDRLRGRWMRQGLHEGRPRYSLIDDSEDPDMPIIEWSKDKSWVAYVHNSWHWWPEILYSNSRDQQTVPFDGWEVAKGAEPAPTLRKSTSN